MIRIKDCEGFVVKNCNGHGLMFTLSFFTERESIAIFINRFKKKYKNWEDAEKFGYKIARLKINIREIK